MERAGRQFVHLHTHTEYSMLDGASRIGELVAAAAEDGQPALGITDHGNLYGLIDFYDACREAGVNPVLGLEAYMARESRFERPARRGRIDDTGGDVDGGSKLYYHLTLLAESNEGYSNLLKLSSAAYLEGYYYKPRVDWELLDRHRQGLIATSGCLGGLVAQSLLAGDEEGAYGAAARLQEIFGRDSFYVEIQDHGIAAQAQTNPGLVRIAKHLGAPLLATNDSHYTHRKDAVTHDALLCVQTGATIDDPKRFRFEGEEHYLKSALEMRQLFSDFPDACDATLEVGDRADVELVFGRDALPRFPVPDDVLPGASSQDRELAYLRRLVDDGAKRRYGSPLPAAVAERLSYELSVIEQMGFPAYFLVVWDLIAFARRRGIRVGPGRGSAAGCCVAYCLGIVDLDPIAHDLLFERFLNPGRKQMPDIDMDFDERYRGDMISYVAERYGPDHVAQIITFSTIKARAAVRDAARVLGLPYAVGDRAAKAMPPLVMGRDTPLYACLDKTEGYDDGYMAAAQLREMCESDADVRKVVDVARGLEGLRRQDGIHAAAVVITDRPLTEYLPVQRKPEPGGNPEDSPIVTQYEMHGVERLGLLKMDFLGLRTLSVIEQACDMIESTTGERPDIDAIPLDDEAVFSMLRQGDSVGVFQLEGGPMRSLMRQLSPTSFDDVAALVALYRPGPMAANMHRDYADRKNGRQQVTYLHPDLEPILTDTFGLMIYQESVMRVAQKFAGYSLEEADNLRKACGKKIRSLIAAEREKFVAGCVTQGYGEELGTQLFDIIEPFADYAFNKSHSYGYGLVAYQTAWLKAHYPVEYLAALLTSVKDDKDKTAVYLAECRAKGISVEVPDVNRSVAGFSVVAGEEGRAAILFGLAAVRNVGEALVSLILEERRSGGDFKDVHDFCARVDPVVLNKRTMESLVKAGGFDSLGTARKGLCEVLDQVVDTAVRMRKEREGGIQSLFDGLGVDDQELPESNGMPLAGDHVRVPIPDIEYPKKERLAYEKEMLGLYVSDHPLMGVSRQLREIAGGTIGDLKDLAQEQLSGSEPGAGDGSGSLDGAVRTLGGVVTSFTSRYTKKGDRMASFVLEDLGASVEVTVFPKVMAEYGAQLAEDAIVVVRGRVDLRDEILRVTALEVRRLELSEEGEGELRVVLPMGKLSASTLRRLQGILVDHPGQTPVLLHVGSKIMRLPEDMRVDSQRGLIAEIKALLGAKAVMS